MLSPLSATAPATSEEIFVRVIGSSCSGVFEAVTDVTAAFTLTGDAERTVESR
jgi:hypothetical protein